MAKRSYGGGTIDERGANTYANRPAKSRHRVEIGDGFRFRTQ